MTDGRTAVYALTSTLLLTIAAHAEEIRVGDTLPAPNLMMLDVRNPPSVPTTWKDKRPCTTLKPGTMTAIGIYDDRVLIRYNIPKMEAPMFCPDGIYAFVSKSAWLEAARQYVQQKIDDEMADKERAIVEEMLKKYQRK